MMKNNWLYVVLIIIATGVLSKYTISQDMVSIVSILVTVMGVVFALYFVIIAIDASKQEKELKRIEKKIANKQNEIIKEIETIQVDHLDTMYSHLIYLAKSINTDAREIKKKQDSVGHSRSKLATQTKFLSPEKRKQRIIELGELGDQSDIKDLEKIIKDPTEDEEMKTLAFGIRDIIMKRQSGVNSNVFQDSTPPSSLSSNTPDDTLKKPQIDPTIALMFIIFILIAALIAK